MEILTNLGAVVLIVAFFFFSYLGIHIVFEKDAKKTIPLIWEKGGILHRLLKPKEYKLFDKSKMKYRDGDNT